MTYSLKQKNQLCKKYMSDINDFWKHVQNQPKSEKGNCYLYYADLRFHMQICPVAGRYNIPLGSDKDTRAQKDDLEVLINDSTKRGKNVVFAYVEDEIIGIFPGK